MSERRLRPRSSRAWQPPRSPSCRSTPGPMAACLVDLRHAVGSETHALSLLQPYVDEPVTLGSDLGCCFAFSWHWCLHVIATGRRSCGSVRNSINGSLTMTQGRAGRALPRSLAVWQLPTRCRRSRASTGHGAAHWSRNRDCGVHRRPAATAAHPSFVA